MNRHFFQHDTNSFNDIKIKQLFIEYGFEGYGVFWRVLELLYQAGGCINESELKSILKLEGGKKMQNILEFLLKYEIILKENDKIFSKRLQNFVENVKKIQKINSINASKRWQNEQKTKENEIIGNAVASVSHYDEKNSRNTNKIKENKIKENKINERVEPSKLDSLTLKDFDLIYQQVIELPYLISNGAKEQTLLKALCKLILKLEPEADLKETVKLILGICQKDKFLSQNLTIGGIVSNFNLVAQRIKG